MSTPLDTVLEHAQEQRDKAMAELLAGEDQVRKLRAQADQLRDYQAEYVLRDPARLGQALTIDNLQTYRQFMQRLEHASSQQQTQVRIAQERSQTLRESLLALELRVASIKKLIESRQREAQRVDEQMQQRRMDEAANQRAWREQQANRATNA